MALNGFNTGMLAPCGLAGSMAGVPPHFPVRYYPEQNSPRGLIDHRPGPTESRLPTWLSCFGYLLVDLVLA